MLLKETSIDLYLLWITQYQVFYLNSQNITTLVPLTLTKNNLVQSEFSLKYSKLGAGITQWYSAVLQAERSGV
jgi:hypothetical protein